MTFLVQQPSPARILAGVRVRPYANSDSPASRVRGQFGHFNYDFVHVSATQDDIFQTLAVPLVHKLVQVSVACGIANAPFRTLCSATKVGLREHVISGVPAGKKLCCAPLWSFPDRQNLHSGGGHLHCCSLHSACAMAATPSARHANPICAMLAGSWSPGGAQGGPHPPVAGAAAAPDQAAGSGHRGHSHPAW